MVGGEEESGRAVGPEPSSPSLGTPPPTALHSYLGLSGHAQDEAEGPSQGGACPGT